MTKKFFSSLLIIILLFSMCACTASNKSYDNQIIELSNNMLEDWGLEEGRTFSVILDSEDIYHIDINGYELLIKIEDNRNKLQEKNNIKECNLEVVEKAKTKLINYIEASNILKGKEELINYINNMPIKIADFSGEDTGAAEYDYTKDIILINNLYLDSICEWMIVHELVHALCQKTNGGIENERYPYAVFNEVLTDIITASMNPCLTDGMVSGYLSYYQWIYLYLGCVGIDGIEAYFYGYDKILARIPEEELDIFVESMEKIDSIEDAIVIVCNCINDWGLEKAS